MENYYDILGVHPTVQYNELKSAYRKLAFRYHPDKNSSPEAEQKFKEINEAYETLTQPELRARYDRLLAQTQDRNSPFYTTYTSPYQATQYQYQRRSQSARSMDRRREFLIQYAPYARILGWIGTLFSILLVIDYVLPEKHQNFVVLQLDQVSHSGEITVYIQGQRGIQMNLGDTNPRMFMPGTQITSYKSPILGIPKRIKGKHDFVERVRISIYGNFIFFPFLLLLSSILTFGKKKYLERQFNAGITSGILLIFNLIVLFIHKS